MRDASFEGKRERRAHRPAATAAPALRCRPNPLADSPRSMATSRIVTELGADLRLTHGPDRVDLDVDASAVPRDALYGAACTFTDRCFVKLSATAGQVAGALSSRLQIALRAKAGRPFDGAALASELEEELLGQALRFRAFDEGRDLTAAIHEGAFGGGSTSTNVDDLGSFDDPLDAPNVSDGPPAEHGEGTA